MAVYPIGDQRVGIERDVPDGDPDEYGQTPTTTVTVWVDNACFEIQTPTEQQNLTVTTSEIAWAMLPIAAEIVPAVDDGGGQAPVEFYGLDDDGNRVVTISANARLIHNGLRYHMRGDAVLEQDIRGRTDHVFCVCEREGG